MTKQQRRRGWMRFGLGLLICSAIWIFWNSARETAHAQEPEKTKAAPSKAPGPKVSLAKIKPKELTLGEAINDKFGKAVEAMQKVLFYPVYYKTHKFVQFDEFEHYYRARDPDDDEKHASDPFVRLSGGEQLKPDEVALQQARGDLSENKKGLLGQDDEKVEYVTRTVNDKKYIYNEDLQVYVLAPTKSTERKALKEKVAKGEKLAEGEYISVTDVAVAGAAGRLKVDSDLKESGVAEPWVQTGRSSVVPLVVVWLSGGAIFFTFYMGGYNFRGFGHAIQIVRGKYDNPDEPGEVTHFQALASALSATVGLGNIAGVTIAMASGGPGAFFWMMACGLFGMTSKFVECTLGQKYRTVKEDGTVLGGPMQYLRAGLGELGLKPLGVLLSIVFAIMCILGSLGGGNMFQANQSGNQLLTLLQLDDSKELGELNDKIKTAADGGDNAQVTSLNGEKEKLTGDMKTFGTRFKIVYGLVLASLVAVVIIGGIKRIGAAAEKVVPTMCIIYCVACLWIIGAHLTEVPRLIGMIFTEAFTGKAMGAGFLGVLVIGVTRAAFSNEAGVGSASIAHSAAKTDEPVREGTVALMGPFIDTIVVCSMTALVILITGAYDNNVWKEDMGLEGASLTLKAFESEIQWFPYVLTVAVVLFAYSTLISWSYYGERCWERMFGARSTVVYKAIFVSCVFIGSIVDLGPVLDFSDMMILSMAFPNILGLLLLVNKVKADLGNYWQRYKAGEFKEYT